MILTTNDYSFLKFLLHQKVMTVDQAGRSAWSEFNTKYVYRRIGQLEEKGFVRYEKFGLGYQKVLFLTQEGLSLLKRSGKDGGFRLPEINHNELAHDLSVNDVRIKFSEMGFTDWTSERRLNQGDHKRGIPDGAFLVETKGLIAIEAELTQKKKSSYYHRFRALFENDRFHVCFYLTEETAIRQLVENEARDFGGVYAGYLSEFLEKGYGATLTRGEFSFPLERLRKYAKV